MEKKETTLLIWVLSLASILVAVLYSPLGSPDLYKNNNFIVEGVVFPGKIINSQVNFAVANNSSEIIIDGLSTKDPICKEPNSEVFNSSSPISDPTKKSVAVIQNTHKQRISSVHIPFNLSKKNGYNNANYSVSSASYLKVANSKDFQGVAFNTQGVIIASKNNRAESTLNPTINALVADLFYVTDSINQKESVDYQENQGGTDPGGNPIADPIPIPEGTYYLLLLIATYTFIKLLFFSKK